MIGLSFLFLLIQTVYGQLSIIPLSSSEYSYQRGNSDSAVKVELFIDLTCSATMDAWGLLNEVVASYQNDVLFEYHLFPLPYHQQAFILTKAAATVDTFGDSDDSIFTFMDTAFENQAYTYNSATADMTYNQVVAMVQPWALNGTGVTAEEYAIGMDQKTEQGGAIESFTRYMWKYATLNEIFGTPLYMINGLKVMGLATFEQWQSTLDPLLLSQKGKKMKKRFQR